MVDQRTEKYWVGFSRAKGIGPVRLRALIQHFGDVERAWKASPAEWRDAGLDARSLASLRATRAKTDLDAELSAVGNAGARIVTIEDSTYPPLLREIPDPPFLLYVRGGLPLDTPAITIVGTRIATSYGQTMARELAGTLAQKGFAIVSGLARGIDAAAHRAALDAGGVTIAVMATGIDQIYPPEHRELAEEIAATGALITELPLGSRPDRLHFIPRNRIVSGLTLATVVVEASERSGALATAGQALEQGREVFAVPGNARSPQSKGTNSLIQTGAKMVTSADDILSELNIQPAALSPRPRPAKAPIREAAKNPVKESLPKASIQSPPGKPFAVPFVADSLETGGEQEPEGENEARVLQQLSADPQDVDDLAYRCGLPVGTVTGALTVLQINGRAQQVGVRRYIRVG